MTTLQRKELWEQTNRWSDKEVDVWFKTKLNDGGEVGLGWSHEEPITDMMKYFVSSYRDLPAYVYQFQTKLRNELRPKSGIMRGREFLMNDMYSYSKTDTEHEKFYDGAINAYKRVFERVGLGDRTFLTFASGGAFTEFSHEFQTLSDAGEDTIYLHAGKKLAINKEVLTDDVMKKLGVTRDELEEEKAVEVGNIFSFGAMKSKDLGLYYKDESGTEEPVILGSYGIGITRLMGTVVEVLSDEKGIVWPSSIAPFRSHLIVLAQKEGTGVHTYAEKLYTRLMDAGIETLYDDRHVSAGEKFADADLIGIPTRVVVSEKTVSEDSVEVKKRKAGESRNIHEDELLEELLHNV